MFTYFCVNISLIMNSFYNTALFDKKVSNLYAIRVGLDNAATSRILVDPAVILILFCKQLKLYRYFNFIVGLRVNQRLYGNLD